MIATFSGHPYRVLEIHTEDEVAAEVAAMKRSPEMLWWLQLLHGEWKLREYGDEIYRTEAYNRLTERMCK